MQQYSFTIRGHKNVLARHKTTLEFTASKELTKTGDCIIGVEADFKKEKLMEFKNCKTVRITIITKNETATITAEPNLEFKDDKELVIRMGVYKSERTFATNASTSAKYLSRTLVSYLQNPEHKAKVEIICDES